MTVLNLTPKKLIVGAAIPMAVLASGGMVWQSSYSAFSATTASPTNNWSAGTVALSDDDSNTAMFTATNLKPGATGTKCIAVTSTGSLASTVKLYGTAYATTNALAANINLKVEEGTGATTASCTGFTGGLDALRRRDEHLRDHQDQLRHRRVQLGPDRLGQRDQGLPDHLRAQREHPGLRPGRHRSPRLHLGVPEQLTRLPTDT